MLTELRTIAQRARETAGEGRVDPALESQRLDIERRIREHSRRRRASEPSPVVSMEDALRAVGDHVLIEYGNIAGELWAVTVRDGRAKMHDLGPIDRLQADIDSIEFALHRLNRTQGSAAAQQAAHETIRVAGERLQAALLPASVLATDRSLVIVPTGRLHGLAWRALPALAARPTVVAPSLLAWAFATRAARIRRAPRTLLIGGPALSAASAELAALARIHRNAVVLDVDESTAERCITQLGEVALAHLACHGSFRSDNPLFSTLPRRRRGYHCLRSRTVPAAAADDGALGLQRGRLGGAPRWRVARDVVGADPTRSVQRDRPADAGVRRAIGRIDDPAPPGASCGRSSSSCTGHAPRPWAVSWTPPRPHSS